MRLPLRFAVLALFTPLAVLLPDGAAAAEKTELQGAAILEHACGKTAVRHEGLVHAGRFDDALALGTPALQAHWQAMPAAQRRAIFRAMREMSDTEAGFSAAIRSHGVLEIEGEVATLTVEKKTQTESGSMTETITQRFVIDAEGCRITL